MYHIWQWAWDRYGPKYSWAIVVVGFPLLVWVYLVLSFAVVVLEKSDQYAEAAAVTMVAVAVLGVVLLLLVPGVREIRLVEH